jgi:AGZA family xanthine/uracil permease-like MFS transporter
VPRQAPTSISTERDVPHAPRNGLDRYFSVSERGSSFEREIRGGLATFFTMAYIVVLNPLIIGTVADGDGRLIGGAANPGVAIGLVAAATALVAGVLTILMGVVGRYPFAIATGLGLNAFVALTIATEMSWADAMGLVVIEGIVITVLVLTGFRTAVFNAIPRELKTAISVGIGVFIALIGWLGRGFVRRTDDRSGAGAAGVGGELRAGRPRLRVGLC